MCFIRGDLIVWREAPSRNYTTPLSSFVLYSAPHRTSRIDMKYEA